MKLKTLEKAAMAVTLLLFFTAVGLTISAQSQRLATDIEIKTNTPQISSQAASSEEGLINLNTAGIDELCQLKGIGPALAQRIIDYRTERGAFTATTDIIDVSGIGFATFENIKHFITV